MLSQSNHKNFLTLNIVRVLLATIVMFHHYEIKIFANSGLAVDFFFILSGFVLAMKFNKSIDLLNFSIDRISRIFPLYFLALTFRLILINEYPDTFSLIANFMLIHMLLLNNSVLGVLNPSWSLSVEFWSNILLLAPVMAITRTSEVRKIILPLLLFLVILIYSLLFTEANFEHWHEKKIGLLSGGFIRCCGGLFLGYITYFVSQNINYIINKRFVNIVFLIFTFFLMFILMGGYGFEGKKVFIVLTPFFIVLSCNQNLNINSFNSKFLNDFSKISYAVYLFHMVVLNILNRCSFINVYSFIAKEILASMLTILASFFIAKYIEPILIAKTRNKLLAICSSKDGADKIAI